MGTILLLIVSKEKKLRRQIYCGICTLLGLWMCYKGRLLPERPRCELAALVAALKLTALGDIRLLLNSFFHRVLSDLFIYFTSVADEPLHHLAVFIHPLAVTVNCCAALM